MITKENYNYWKNQIVNFEKEQKRLLKFKGKSTCPFCGGSKTIPFMGTGKSQDCNECDKNGMILNRTLAEHELEDLIEK